MIVRKPSSSYVLIKSMPSSLFRMPLAVRNLAISGIPRVLVRPWPPTRWLATSCRFQPFKRQFSSWTVGTLTSRRPRPFFPTLPMMSSISTKQTIPMIWSSVWQEMISEWLWRLSRKSQPWCASLERVNTKRIRKKSKTFVWLSLWMNVTVRLRLRPKKTSKAFSTIRSGMALLVHRFSRKINASN